MGVVRLVDRTGGRTVTKLADVHEVRGKAPIPEYHVKEQLQAEVNRAAVENRDPDLDNPPPTVGNQLAPVVESKGISEELAPTPTESVDIATGSGVEASVPYTQEVGENDGNPENPETIVNTEHEHEYKDNGGY